MRKFKGVIKTNVFGSECEFEFEVPDNTTDKEIEDEAKEAAFNWVSWEYHEVG